MLFARIMDCQAGTGRAPDPMGTHFGKFGSLGDFKAVLLQSFVANALVEGLFKGFKPHRYRKR